VRQVSPEARREKREEDDCRSIHQNGLLKSHAAHKVVSFLPSSPPNRIVSIALNLQLPLNLEAAERTNPRETESSRATPVPDPTVEAARRKKALRRVRKYRRKLLYSWHVIWVARHGPPSAVPR